MNHQHHYHPQLLAFWHTLFTRNKKDYVEQTYRYIMPKSNSSIPPSILSFVKKSKSLDDDYGNDEDRAFLIPSHGSSFNLAEDTEYLRPSISDLRGPSTRNTPAHHAIHPSTSHFSTSSSKSSRAASQASSNSGGKTGGHHHHRHHHHHSNRSNLSGGSNRSGRKGSGNGKHRRKLSSSRVHQNEFDSSHSANSRSSAGSHSSGAGSHSGERSYSKGQRKIERQNTVPIASDDGGGYIQKKPSSTSALQDSDDGYLLGYDSDNIPRGLKTPIVASTCFQSGMDNMPRNKSQNTINTIHSGRSYKSQKSTNTSNRSGKSTARRKLKRQEQRREWVRRWRRRQFVGTVILTTIYSLLCAYTLIVTLGPLFLQIYDPDLIEWCPYYWDDEYHAEHDKGGQHTSNSAYSLNIDQLQQYRQGQHYQDEDGNGQQQQQRRRLATRQRDEPLSISDLKKIEINMLKRTSKDVHNSDNDEGSDEEKSKYENPDYNDDPCHLMRIPFLFYLTLEECDLSRRMATSVLLGGFIGYERRASDRPAGIRTMALVALGSCFFTISSQLAFRDSPMTWDSSRVTAASK